MHKKRKKEYALMGNHESKKTNWREKIFILE